MTARPKTFYKYRTFNTLTLDSLCNDTIYYASPGSFNDPLDCNPTLDGDSTVYDLRTLLTVLIRRRVEVEVMSSLQRARLRGKNATAHAELRGQREAVSELSRIAYNATNPDYDAEVEEAERWLLQQAVEREFRQHYQRGVCCFSTSYDSYLLWSHYGDQHQGLCIGYGIERKPRPVLRKVKYGGRRTIKTSRLVAAFVHQDATAMKELDGDVLLRKASGWGYEREWRLIGQQGIQDSPLLLTDVTFGLRCPESVKHAVIRSLSGRDNEVLFYEMYEVPGAYRLARSGFDIEAPVMSLPITARSGEEIFGADSPHQS